MANVDREKVLAILLERGPMKNAEIRMALHGNTDWDKAGTYTTEALQRLKLEKRVALLPGGRWAAADVIQCPACDGKGHIERTKAEKLGLVKKGR